MFGLLSQQPAHACHPRLHLADLPIRIKRCGCHANSSAADSAISGSAIHQQMRQPGGQGGQIVIAASTISKGTNHGMIARDMVSNEMLAIRAVTNNTTPIGVEWCRGSG